MNKCLLTYEWVETGEYKLDALRKIAPKLTEIRHLPFDATALRYEASARAGKMSIQGVQSKLSAVLNTKNNEFEIVDQNGRYIIKPQSANYPNMPENEDLTMHLASMVGINVPIHGLIRAQDDSLVYFIKRFDRIGQKQRVSTEDFSQILGFTRETKYESSMESIVDIIDQYCTFPIIEKSELFKRTIFNFLVGNEDMHLKNFSLITDKKIVRLTPAYDFLNSSILLREPEEIALPLHGRKKNLSRKILVKYYGQERLKLNEKVIENVLKEFDAVIPSWKNKIECSFLPQELIDKYLKLLSERSAVLFMMQSAVI
ncbi:MAG: type II toxin-antitoxin system HipA family toxin [Proteobacteria bacterium]|nr:MAG: type II toxin-antitoxin system HipA family toxin [Pseudomonadota bacterium]